MKRGKLVKRIFVSVSLLWVSSMTVNAQTVQGCGRLENAYGPFDYRDPIARRDNLPVVENNHFTPEIEMLNAGKDGVILSGTLAGHLDYTLRAFPNHHRALDSVATYALRGGPPSLSGRKSADCYFRRAIAFRNDDEIVRMVYANYLFKRRELSGAREQYEEALRLAPESVEVNYNAGLYFAQTGDLPRAKQLAKVAYDGGYPLPGLKRIIAEAEGKTSSK